MTARVIILGNHCEQQFECSANAAAATLHIVIIEMCLSCHLDYHYVVIISVIILQRNKLAKLEFLNLARFVHKGIVQGIPHQEGDNTVILLSYHNTKNQLFMIRDENKI